MFRVNWKRLINNIKLQYKNKFNKKENNERRTVHAKDATSTTGII